MEGNWLTDLALEKESTARVLEILAKTLVAEVVDLTAAVYSGDRRKCWHHVGLMRRGGLVEVEAHPQNARKKIAVLTAAGAKAVGLKDYQAPAVASLVGYLKRSKRYFPLFRLFEPSLILSRSEFLRRARLDGASAFFLDWYVAGPKGVGVYRNACRRIKKSVLAVDGTPFETAFHVAVEPAKLVRPRLTALYRSSKITKRLLVVSEEDLGPCLETLLSPDGWPGPASKALASVLGADPGLVPADRDHGIWSVPSLGRFLLDGRYNDVGAAWRARDSSYISASLLVFLSTDGMADWWWRRFPSAWVLLEDPPKILKPKTRRRSRTEEPSFAPRPDTPARRIERYL